MYKNWSDNLKFHKFAYAKIIHKFPSFFFELIWEFFTNLEQKLQQLV